MDKQILALFIPIMALGIGLVAVVMGGLTKRAKLKSDGQRGNLPGEVESRMAALEDDVNNLRRELGETQERVDFTERMLAQRSEQKQLEK